MTGPSLTSSTLIRAPKTPVATETPWPERAAQKRSTSGFATSGRAASEKPGRLPFAGVGEQRELAHDEDLATGIEHGEIELPVARLEDPKPRDLAGQPVRLLGRVVRRDAEQHEQSVRRSRRRPPRRP